MSGWATWLKQILQKDWRTGEGDGQTETDFVNSSKHSSIQHNAKHRLSTSVFSHHRHHRLSCYFGSSAGRNLKRGRLPCPENRLGSAEWHKLSLFSLELALFLTVCVRFCITVAQYKNVTNTAQVVARSVCLFYHYDVTEHPTRLHVT